MIPIIIISHNNHQYVDNTIKQLRNIREDLLKDVIVMDNNSSDLDTLSYLNNLDVNVQFNKKNEGPWISPVINSVMYNVLPDRFIITDPDLEFNKSLPVNFMEILKDLSKKYSCSKIGFSLFIGDWKNMYSDMFYNIEKQYWDRRIKDSQYELYDAPIDTTFCLVNKNGNGRQIRVAGNFTARHYPWYKDEPILSIYDKYITYNKQSNISTIKKVVLPYISKNFFKFEKNGEIFFIGNESQDDIYWKNGVKSKMNLFTLFENNLTKDKDFLIVGDRKGLYSMFCSRKSRKGYVFSRGNELKNNIHNNCRNIILNTQRIDDSSSNDLFNGIVWEDIMMITVVEDEEVLLDKLFIINRDYNIPIYIEFNFSKWINKDLDRFLYLKDSEKKIIKNSSNLYLPKNTITPLEL